MPLSCPKGTSLIYRFRKTLNGNLRLGGCARAGKFIKGGVKEAKYVKAKKE